MAENEEVNSIETPADFGQFVLEKELGHGGMGSVYLGRDKMLERPVAIKVMLKSMGADAEFVERFKREAQAAARLNHPNIAQIYSFSIQDGQPYIAMELVSGGSLDKEMVQNPGTLDPVHVMNVGKQVAEGLSLAAQSGLVHGDVKPENILFDEEGNAKLVDFGLAAMQGDSSEIWGTPYYISPEKVRRQKIDLRADIYSLGGTLYHALTGVAPFEGADATEVVTARFNGPAKKPSEIRPDLPPELDSILLRMLEVEPAMRYPTYESLLSDLNRYLASARPAKKTATATRVKLKGRKPKMRLTAEGGAEMLSADESIPSFNPDGIADLENLEEEKKGLSLGAIVGMVIGGVVLLILLITGSLIWYVHATKVGEARDAHTTLVSMMQKETKAINTTIEAVEKYMADFSEMAVKPEKEMKEAVVKLRNMLPEDMKAEVESMIEVPPTKDIAEAIAYTNSLYVAAIAQAEAEANAKVAEEKAKVEVQAASTNAPSATSSTNAPAAQVSATNAPSAAVTAATTNASANAASAPAAKKDEQPSEAPTEAEAEEEKKEEKPKIQIPSSITQFSELWNDVYLCNAANIRVQAELDILLDSTKDVKKIHFEAVAKLNSMLESGALKDDINAYGTKPVKDLEKIMLALPDGFESTKAKKWVELSRRKSSTFSSRLKNIMQLAERQIAAAKARAEKAAKEAAEKAAKEEAAAKAAEERKVKIEEETAKAQQRFEELVNQRLKYLDWDPAMNQLDRLAKEFQTIEGKEAVRIQKKKIQCMKSMNTLFMRSRGFKFRDGSMITKADSNGITVKGRDYTDRKTKKKVLGKTQTIDWKKLYFREENRGKLSQMINGLLLKGPEATHSGPMAWSEATLGAALTMQALLSDVAGVDQFIPVLVQKAVKGFEPNRKYAEMWFKDVKIEQEEL